MKKELKDLDVYEQESIMLLEQLMQHPGWVRLNELMEKNDVAKLKEEMTSGETVADVNGLDSVINHSFHMRWTQAKINLLRAFVDFPASYIALISDDPEYKPSFDPWGEGTRDEPAVEEGDED